MGEYTKYYRLEQYLFKEVGPRFRKEGCLTAEAFFCIVIWKANRAKSKTAAKLLQKAKVRCLAEGVQKLTSALVEASSSKERMRILIKDWGFRLPMASAVLTVLYPEEFTVYDIRVVDELEQNKKGPLHQLANSTDFDKSIWPGYEQFIGAVRAAVPDEDSLRDKDRELWGRSFFNQLVDDIRRNFQKAKKFDRRDKAASVEMLGR